nr:homocysteine S-methyltransferase family protein [Candidatus Neomarinimicrobiota bacterium]
SNFLENYGRKLDLPLILYANAGIYSRKNGWCEDPNFTPQNYAQIAANWLKSGAKIIGGCCGTTPDFIKALADLRKSPV